MRFERVYHYKHGGSLAGYLPEGFSCKAVSAVFGEPTNRADDGNGKVTLEWRILFAGEVFAAIYDWKGGNRFHIGGRSELAVRLVSEALGVPCEVVRY